MVDPFKNPLAPRERKSSKTFIAPTKEEATTGRFMDAGDEYGVGFKAPVGKMKAEGLNKGPIPQMCERIDPENLL